MMDNGGISTSRLQVWLQQTLGDECKEILGIRPASNGFSAETVFVQIAAIGGAQREVVVRLEHPGQEIFLDTRIELQAKAMQSLKTHGAPVPSVIGFETDPSAMGRAFIVMDLCSGKSFPQMPNYNVAGWVKELDSPQRAKLWHNALTAIGQMNRLTPDDGFAFLDRPRFGARGLEQYLGWLRVWRDDTLGAREHSIIDAGLRYLQQHQPENIPVSFLWGDSNPCNMLFEPDLAVSAILDFEAAALGPAEVDLGWWFFLDRSRLGNRPPLAGIPNREEAIAIYQQALGRPAQAMDYFEILGGVKMALVIVRTVDRLVAAGQMEAGTDASIANPLAGTLASLLGMPLPPLGTGFAKFTAAMKH